MVALNFNASTVDPAQSFDPVPPGDYLVHIKESEMAATKTGGQMLKLTLEILDGQYKGRLVWDRLNLVNNNPQAVEIGYRTLSAICHAAGVIDCQDSSQLHGRPMVAKVKVRPGDGNYDPSNEVRGYSAANAAQPQPSTPAAVPVAAAPADAATPPWKRAG